MTSSISIILVQPEGEANIGQAARTMKNFGIRDLRLVQPKRLPSKTAYDWAVSARNILDHIQIYDSLDNAIADCTHTIALSRRLGSIRQQHLCIHDIPNWIAQRPQSKHLAFIFGTETDGLSNDDIAKADIIATIPTHTDLPSMNLAQSVAITCYEISKSHHLKFSEELTQNSKRSYNFESKENCQELFNQIKKFLFTLEYDNKPDNPLQKKIYHRLISMIGRAGVSRKDINMLIGLMSHIIKKTNL